MTRRISPQGLDLIKQFEGLRLKPYYCDAGVLTVGYGSTGAHVIPGVSITRAEAEALLTKDLGRFEACVDRLVKTPLTDNQFAALVSLCFNIGEAAFLGSTLLRKLNSGDLKGAAEQFGKWVRGGGKVLPGLVKRRASERALFELPPTPPPAVA